MTTTSADPDRLQNHLDNAMRLRGELGVAETNTRAAYAMFLNNSSIGGGALGGLEAMRPLLTSMEQNERFLAVVRDALVEADHTYRAGPVTIVDSVIAQHLESAGLTNAPTPIMVMDASLLGVPVNSGFVDDPICTANGNFVHHETDVAFPARSSALSFVRTYNALAAKRSSSFGPGWTSILDVQLRISDQSIVAMLVDGAEITFIHRDDGTYVPVARPQLRLSRTDTGFSLQDKAGSTWDFSADGSLVERDIDGTCVAVRRDDGRVVSLLANGRSVAITWQDDRVVRIVTNDDRVVTYSYVDGHLVGSKPAAGGLSYAIADDRIERITDADGVLVAANVYDEFGRVARQQSPHGRTSLYTYGDTGVTVSSDTDGAARNAFVHDQVGNLTAMIDASGYALRMRYDDHGNMTSWTDRRGGQWTMEFDLAVGKPVCKTGPLGLIEQWEWDAAGRLVAHHTPAGVARYSYTGSSNTPTTITDSSGAITTLVVGDNDRPVAIADADGVRTELSWDGDGQLVASTNDLGNTCRLSYDDAGNLVSVQKPSGIGVHHRYGDDGRVASTTLAGASSSYEWSAAGRPVGGSDPGEGAWSATYGAGGMLTRLIDSSGAGIEFAYDLFGSIHEVAGPDGRRYHQAHDGLSQLVSTTDPSGLTWNYEYDPEGALIAIIDPSGAERRRVVDTLGRTTDEIDAEGRRWSRIYNDAGQLSRTVDPTGVTTSFAYDDAGRVVSITDTTGYFETYAYSAAGRVVGRADSVGRSGSFTYDSAGRLSSSNDGNGLLKYLYDVDDNVVEIHDADGMACTIAYDDAGRAVGAVDRRGRVRRVEVDNAGRPVRSFTGESAATFEWTIQNVLSSATDPLGARTSFAHDVAGRLTAMTDPLGAVTQVHHDVAGRVSAVTNPLGEVHRLLRNGVANVVGVVGVESNDGAEFQRTVDRSGRTTLYGTCGDDCRLGDHGADCRHGDHGDHSDGDQSVMVAYNDAGRAVGLPTRGQLRLAAPVERVAVVSTDSAGRIVGAPDGAVFRHDAAGRLVEWVPPDGPAVRYEYDSGGRLVAEHHADSVVCFTHGLDGRVLSRTDNAGTATYFYDGLGRRVLEQRSDGSTVTYEWDAASRLFAVIDSATQRFDVLYNNLGLVAAVNDISVMWDLTTGWPIVSAIGESSAVAVPANVDWMGNAEPVLDPWGMSEGTGVRVGYRSELCVDNLVWLQARVYDPMTRSFLSPDPLPMVPGQPCAANVYHYAWNDPVTNVDPSGMRPLTHEEFVSRMSREERNVFSKAWDSTTDAVWDGVQLGVQTIPNVGVVFSTSGLHDTYSTVTNGLSSAAQWTTDAALTAGHWAVVAGSAGWSATKWTVDALGAIGNGTINVFIGITKGAWQIGEDAVQLAVLSYKVSAVHAVIDFDGWKNDVSTTASALAYMNTHPDEVLKGIAKDTIAWDRFANGDVGQGIGNAVFNIGSFFIGVGELKGAVTASRTAREAAEATAAAEAARIEKELISQLQSTKNGEKFAEGLEGADLKHFGDLAQDPARGGKITDQGVLEAYVAIDLERSSRLAAPLTRSIDPKADFVDALGQLWDLKSFNSNYAPRKGGFTLEDSISSLEKDIGNNERIIVDTTNMTTVHIAQLREAVQAAGWDSIVIWWP